MNLHLIIYFVYKNLVVVMYFLRSGCLVWSPDPT